MTRDTGFPTEVVDLIWDRDKGACAKCGRGLVRERRGDSWAIHHREPRGSGGSSGRIRRWVNLAANGVCLCTTCHEEIEAHRTAARLEGFLVSGISIILPADTPILHALHGWVRLDDDGGWELAA